MYPVFSVVQPSNNKGEVFKGVGNMNLYVLSLSKVSERSHMMEISCIMSVLNQFDVFHS